MCTAEPERCCLHRSDSNKVAGLALNLVVENDNMISDITNIWS